MHLSIADFCICDHIYAAVVVRAYGPAPVTTVSMNIRLELDQMTHKPLMTRTCFVSCITAVHNLKFCSDRLPNFVILQMPLAMLSSTLESLKHTVARSTMLSE